MHTSSAHAGLSKVTVTVASETKTVPRSIGANELTCSGIGFSPEASLRREVKLAKHATQSSDTLSFSAIKGSTPYYIRHKLAI
jgi:hypothetical protein